MFHRLVSPLRHNLTRLPAIQASARALAACTYSSTPIDDPSIAENKALTEENINQNLVKAQYAVRGRIPARAVAINRRVEMEQLRGERPTLPFSKVISCHIGNPQDLKQKPITFFREVMSLCESPKLVEPEMIEVTKKVFSTDSIERASSILSKLSPGAYSNSQGHLGLREEVAHFIAERDGHPSFPENIFLTGGASEGISAVLGMIIKDPKVGVMIPVPQYPLYSAAITLLNGTNVPYYLDESKGWQVDAEHLRAQLQEARDNGTDVRAMCIINPGNPTGQCLSYESIQAILEFCNEEKLVVLADEVYQENVYYPEEAPFHSFKKVLSEMGTIGVELFSFHSISKGFVGECGRRGGYFEVTNLGAKVQAQLIKRFSISLCSNTFAQIMVALMTNPPKEGDVSYESYISERDGILGSLKRRSIKLANALGSLEGVKCDVSKGAMYAFPRVTVPKGVVDAAKASGQSVDEYYCMEMLEKTGVCVVPGSGFSMVPQDNTFWYRITFLPPEEEFDGFLSLIEDFHNELIKEHA